MRLISDPKVQQMDLRASPTSTTIDGDQIEILRKAGTFRLNRLVDPTPKVRLCNFTRNFPETAPIDGIQFSK